MTERPIYLPSLSHWEHGNPWSGSRGEARYMVRPDGTELSAELWRGPMSREFAAPERAARFPVSDEGIELLRAWLAENATQLNGSI